ncbi:MAG: hypothetical protein K4571_09915 [Deltaproteobacteria bacterium]
MSEPTIQRPDVHRILSKLKPFQRDTAEYVFQRLYLDSDPTHRFLVADEAGLGKTMVAKGLLAKAIDYLWDSVKRIDIVYICSNADIARQNLRRLNLSGHDDIEFASRITLLPTNLDKLQKRKLNFVSFTPGTSFDMKASMGMAEERRLLYWMLHDAWNLENRKGPQNVMQGYVSKADWWGNYLSAKPNFDPGMCTSFIEFINKSDEEELKAGKKTTRERFDILSDYFFRSDRRITRDFAVERNRVIGLLRRYLAKTCIKLLEPDIVIMDEFQRFKNLLSDEDEAGQLAQELFNYADENTKVRILLLSATPYKMYTQYDDQADDHYQDFIDTVEFLEKVTPIEIETLLKEFRQELFRTHDGNFNKLVEIKARLEKRLRKVISRKERIAGSIIHDDMLEDQTNHKLPVLTTNDIQQYLALQKIAFCLGHGDMIEYWKSAPYLLNFMDSYKIKEQFHCAVAEKRMEDLTAIINNEPSVVLPWQDVKRYSGLEPANPRLRQLLDDVIDNDAWQLLWMPPSLPYYSTDKGPYAKFPGQQLTKRLIFSSWTVVPKMIAAMVSYEAERRMFSLMPEKNPEYSPEWRKKQGTLLKFAVSDRLSGMPILGILYPCFTLARECDPLQFYSDSLKSTNEVPSLKNIKHVIASIIQRLLDNLIVQENISSTTDENWYWAAPILLDLQDNKTAAVGWFNEQKQDQLWSGMVNADADDKESNWSAHVAQAKRILDGTIPLGRRPDDLVEVLTLMALGGPSIVALRAVCRIFEDNSFYTNADCRNTAASIAWGFRSFFNRPEVTCLLRGLNLGVAYWQRVLDYSTEGGLQSVLDEYIHVLREYLGIIDFASAKSLDDLATAVLASLQLITARIDIERLEQLTIERKSMRGHFALRFGVQDAEDSGTEPTREDRVRQAFNSPFWPFVLASTSVGQEGLDFHPYCHAIIHWNLPSNPVDLEQREGRIHRYKGHAIRKNIAKEYGHVLNNISGQDPWEVMFTIAAKDHSSGSRGYRRFGIFLVVPESNAMYQHCHLVAIK